MAAPHKAELKTFTLVKEFHQFAIDAGKEKSISLKNVMTGIIKTQMDAQKTV